MTVKHGKCPGGHEVGHVFLVGWTIPEGMGLSAWNAIAPSVFTLLCGGNFPWEKERGVATLHCPDPHGISFELRYVEEYGGSGEFGVPELKNWYLWMPFTSNAHETTEAETLKDSIRFHDKEFLKAKMVYHKREKCIGRHVMGIIPRNACIIYVVSVLSM
jgi:uncharacterized repeat protein (TIGR04076 family)